MLCVVVILRERERKLEDSFVLSVCEREGVRGAFCGAWV